MLNNQASDQPNFFGPTSPLLVPFGNPRKSNVVEFLKLSYRNIIDPESEWNVCKHSYFFCRHLNGSVDVHGPSLLSDAESICQGMDC